MPMIRSTSSIAVFVLTLCFIPMGCDRPATKKDVSSQADKTPKIVASPESAPNLATDGVARNLLESCISKYKQLKSYEDNGLLTIRIPTSDPLAPLIFSEPMRVAFEVPNRLALEARSLSATWSTNATAFEAVVRENKFQEFGQQRLVRSLPDKFDLTWLIVDNLGPILDPEVSGTPIPILLQLLFDPKPLAYFLSPESKISMLESKVFDSVKCERVQVSMEGLNWVFWIDKDMLMFRKYELPSKGIEIMAMKQLLPPNFLPANFDPNKSEIAVELGGAKANPRIDWNPWQIPNRANEIAVRRFIDAPPRNTPKILGQEVAPFDLLGPDGKRILDSAQRAKPITVLCWVTDDEIGENFVKYLFDVQREMEKRLLSKAEIVLVSQAGASAMQESLKKWGCSLPLAIDTEKLAQNTFFIQRQPAIVVLDKDVRVQFFDDLGYLGLLPDIIENLHRGVDIAKRRLQMALDDEERYISRLHRAIVDKAQAEKLPPIGPFQFMTHGLQPRWREKLADPIVAASAEHSYPQAGKPVDLEGPFATNAKRQRVMTFLDDVGQVHTVDNTGAKTLVAKIPTDQIENPKRIHVLPDPWTHRWIAIVPEGLPRYWLIDTAANPDGDPIDAIQIEFDEKEESPSAFVWAVRDGDPVLAIATSRSKLEVLYPPRERFRSDLVGEVAAIVPTINDFGHCESWNLVKSNGEILEIEALRSKNAVPPNLQNRRLKFLPNQSSWEWGRNGKEGVLLGMSQLQSGETGTVLQSRQFEPRMTRALSVRPEQCRILSATTLPNGAMYWLATAPNRLLHLNTADNFDADQMSLGTKVFGAGIFPEGTNLRMVLAVGNEVNCWSIEIPKAASSVSAGESARGEKEAISPSERPSG